MSWDENLSPSERAEWDRWVAHIRADTVGKIAESAMVMSLVPDGEPDVQFAVELGLGILMNKPIVLLAINKRDVPEGLARIAHAIVEVDDFDTEAGQLELQRKLEPILAEFGATT